MSKPESLRQRDQAFLEAAMALAPRSDVDGSIAHDDMIAALEQVLPRDNAEKAHRRKAERFHQDMSHPGRTEPEGQLSMFGDLYDYEPKRPVIGPDERTIEQDRAPPSFKAAEARRARENAKKADALAERKTNESEGYSAWSLQQAQQGRPAFELTFGNYVRESGVLR